MTRGDWKTWLFPIVVTLCTLPGVARADWEFTKWGMTRAEVIAAANKRAFPLTNTFIRPYRGDGMNITCSVQTSPYTVAGFQFDSAKFCFSDADGKLSAVLLDSFARYRFDLVDRALRASFGQPIYESPGGANQFDGPKRMFNDRQKGNSILLDNMLRNSIWVLYYPLKEGF
jgi:hypothetical protein